MKGNDGKNGKEGFEDHFTDMDFKTAGTSTGVTAIQLDMKRQGIPPSILQNALKVGTNTRKKMSTILNRQSAFSPPHKMKNGVKQNVILNKWEIGVSNSPVLQKATLLE